MISLFRNTGRPPAAADQIEIDGRLVPVVFRTNVRARRIILRLAPGQQAGDPDRIAITLPSGVDHHEGLQFALANHTWIKTRLLSLPQRIPFVEGATIPLLGAEHIIRHAPHGRRGVWLENQEIYVSGPAEHLPRRVGDWLKKQARTTLTAAVSKKAEAGALQSGRISVRDTRSRWGSCAANGNLSFSWRLILTPEYVCDYVVAHEVAHLAEHNHSKRFWAVVDQLTPHAKEGKRWLKAHGDKVHRYG